MTKGNEMSGNILIVDDSPEALKLLHDMLVAKGYQTRPFNNGELALRSMSAQPPELILLDVRMPLMNGFEVCRQIKADARLNEIPVIFISAAADMEDKLQAFAAGGVDYITKPFQKEEVLARVHTHVALHRSRQKLLLTEMALRKSEQSLRIAQAVAHLGHWEMDVQSGKVTWSDETYRILGIDPNTTPASQEAFLSIVQIEDRDRVANCIEQARNGIDFDTEFRVVLSDGRSRVVHGKGVLIALPHGAFHSGIIGTVRLVNEIIGVVQDITERKELELRLEQEVRTDVLTGCATRRHFMELAHSEFSRARRYGSAMSLLMLDLDHFKKINDTYGHHIGDLTLRKTGQIIQDILRQEDTGGRLGGEEFAALLIETDKERAFEVAERLRQAMSAAEILLENDDLLRFTASIGVASAEADDLDVEVVIKRADQALYQAKNVGRNRVA